MHAVTYVVCQLWTDQLPEVALGKPDRFWRARVIQLRR